MLYNIFPTPIYVVDAENEELKSIQDNIRSKIEGINLEVGKPWGDNVNTTYKHDGNNDILNKFDLHFLKRFICEHVEKYYFNFKTFRNRSFFINNSWINFVERNGFQYSHQHCDCQITGVYYYQTTGNDGDLILETPLLFNKSMLFPNSYDDEYSTEVVVKPKNGRLILFPFWLQHRVCINETDDTRVSITFNASFMGK